MSRDIGQYISSIPLNGSGALLSGAQPALQSLPQPIKFVQQQLPQLAQQQMQQQVQQQVQQVPQQIVQQVQQVPQQIVQQVQQVPQQVVQQVLPTHQNAFTNIPVDRTYNSLTRNGGPTMSYQANQPLQIDLIPSVLTPPPTPVATPVTTLERKKKKVVYVEPESESESEPEPEPEPEPKPVKKVQKKIVKQDPVIIQPPKQVVIMEPVTPVIVTEAPRQQQVQTKSILKTTTPVLTPVPVPVIVTPTPKQAPTIITEPVSKVSVPEDQEEDEEDEGDCCGYSWKCCTITWGVLFGLLLAGLIACIVVSLLNQNKQNELLSTGFQCNIDWAKSMATTKAPGSSSTFPLAYTSSPNHLGISAPDTQQVLMVGTGVQMTNKRPNRPAFIVWECGCPLKITYTSQGAGQEVRMGNTMVDHTIYTFYVMQQNVRYTIEMEACSLGHTLIAIKSTQTGDVNFN